jgi:hypothetical protein
MCQAAKQYGDGEEIKRQPPPPALATGMAPGLMLVTGTYGAGGRMYRTKPLPKFPTPPKISGPTTDPNTPKDPLSIFRRRYAPTSIPVRADVNMPR